jgi:hypothetical protein
MLLSLGDIKRLERVGHDRQEFVRFNKQGFAQLRNSRGYCVFYQAERHNCRVYSHRPLGCRSYPIIYSEEEGVIVDDLCPLAATVSQSEIESKAEKLKKLLQRIDAEAGKRKACI